MISFTQIRRNMIFLLLIIMACLLDTSRTKQFHHNLDREYIQQMMKSAVHPPQSTYQHLLATAYPRNSIDSSAAQPNLPKPTRHGQPSYEASLLSFSSASAQSHASSTSNPTIFNKPQPILSRFNRNVNYRNSHQTQSPLPLPRQQAHARAQQQQQQQQQADSYQQHQQSHNKQNKLLNLEARESSITSPSSSHLLLSKSSSPLNALLRSPHSLLATENSIISSSSVRRDDGGFTVPTATTASSTGSTTTTTTSARSPASSSSSGSTGTESASPPAATKAANTNDNTQADGGGGGLAMASSITNGIMAPSSLYQAHENPAAMFAANNNNVIESIDVDGGLGNLNGANYDFTYTQLPVVPTGISPAAAATHGRYGPLSAAASSSNNSTMALYRLLNLIDQSGGGPVPSAPLVSLPFQNSKTLSANVYSMAYSPPLSGRFATSSSPTSVLVHANNFDNNYNGYNYHTVGMSPPPPPLLDVGPALVNSTRYYLNSHQFNGTSSAGGRSHPPPSLFASQLYPRAHQQTSSSSMPNHWSSRSKRPSGGQMYWPQQQHHRSQRLGGGGGADILADLNSHTNGLGLGNAATSAARQQLNGNLLFADNLIETQQPPAGAAMKLMKSSHPGGGYMNANSPRRNTSHHHHYHNQPAHRHHERYHDREGGSESGHGGGGNQYYNAHNGSTHSNNNSNQHNAGSEDAGFENSRRGGPQSPQPASPPRTTTASSGPTAGGGFSEKVNGGGGGLTPSSSSSNSKVPHDADSEMIAANNAPRCDKFTPDICVDDFEYPEQAIIDEIQKKRDVFELMYSEVKDNEPLVDGIPRDVEESYNYEYYYSGKANLSQAASSQPPVTSSVAGSGDHSHNQQQVGAGLRLHSTPRHQPRSSGGQPPSASLDLDGPLASSRESIAASIDGMDALIGATPQATNAAATTAAKSPPTTGYICPSEVMYGKPKLAKNKKGLWKVIVNAGEFTQTVRLEKCLFPNKKCNYVSASSYESRCAQVHSHHRLLVFEKGRGFYIDTFRLPTGCNCYVSQKPYASGSSPTSSSIGSGNNRRDSSNGEHGDSGAGGNDGYGAHAVSRPAAGSRLPALIGDSFNGQRDSSASYSSGASNSRVPSSESMLSQTLWSILSGGGGAGGHSNQLASTWANQNYAGDGGGDRGGAMTNMPPNYQRQHNYEPAATSDQGNQFYHHPDHAGPVDSPPPLSSAAAYGAGSSSSLFDYQRAAGTSANSGSSGGGRREAHQSQSLILEHLSQNPSLAANISDSVLRQLIDVGQISASASNGNSGVSAADSATGELVSINSQRYQNPNRATATMGGH